MSVKDFAKISNMRKGLKSIDEMFSQVYILLGFIWTLAFVY